MGMPDELVPALSAAVATVAAIATWAGVIFQRRDVRRTIATQIAIAARQSRANVVSASRQQWIDALRDDVAEVLATKSAFRGLGKIRQADREGRDMLRSSVGLLHRIELRLNPDEPEHRRLLETLRALLLTSDHAPDLEIELLSTAKFILKAEWQRVKREASGEEPITTPLSYERS